MQSRDPRGGYLTGLLGTGIAPSLSPALHEREAAALGLRCTYRLLDLDHLGRSPADAPDLVRAALDAGYDGLNVTHPCKQLVQGALDDVSPDAAAIGAVNTVVLREGRAVGHNTDHSGFARALATGLPDVALERVLLLGAGGAGAAVGHALLGLGTTRLTVVDVDPVRAAQLAGQLAGRFGAGRVAAAGHDALLPTLDAADGLVHATPTGMAAHPGSPVPASSLRRDLWVADVVYRPLETELVLAARAAGAPVLDGGAMAVHQAADAFELFTGVQPDRHRMVAHLAALVAAGDAAQELAGAGR